MKQSCLAVLFILCIAMPSWAQRDKLVRNGSDKIPVHPIAPWSP